MFVSSFSNSLAFRKYGKIAAVLNVALPKASACAESVYKPFNEFYSGVLSKISSLIEEELLHIASPPRIPIKVTLQCIACEKEMTSEKAKHRKKAELILVQGKIKIKGEGNSKEYSWLDVFDKKSGAFLK